MELLKHQIEGIDFLINNSNCILADEMGLGKTIQYLKLVEYIKKNIKNYKILIITTKTLIYNLLVEMKKWNLYDNRIFVNKDILGRKEPFIFILNYDVLWKYRYNITGRNYDLIIYDEFHYLKNINSKRSQIALRLINKSNRIVGITGTPALNNTREFFTLCYIAGIIKNIFEIELQFDYLEKKYSIMSKFLLRKKTDVLDLPAKLRIPLILHSCGIDKYLHKEISEYNKYRNITKLERKYKKLLETETTKYLLNTLEKLKEFKMNRSIKFNKMRIIISKHKFNLLLNDIISLINNNNKIALFCFYYETINYIKYRLNLINIKTIEITGKTKDKIELINKFNNDNSIKVAIINTKIAVGFNLTSANYCYFVELYWNFRLMYQAEDRLHRIGQTKTVFSYYTILKGSYDEKLSKRIANKEKNIKFIYND